MAWLLKCSAILIFSLGLFAKAEPVSEMHFNKGKIRVGPKTLSVEMAETDAQQEYGLMYRKKMPADDGMLFVFQVEKPQFFWMKNTLIDLSIGYFDKDGILIDVQEMTATSVMDENPPSYPSKKPAMYALEMNKGWFEKNKIKVGTKLKILVRRQ